MDWSFSLFFFFFFNDTATTEIYTLSLHDALPISGYLRESMANTGGPYETSRRTDRLAVDARLAAAQFLGSDYEEVVFGPNMTTLNFMLTRTLGRTLRARDEIVVTKLDHDANVAPWLELARDLDLVVKVAEIRDDCTLDLEH